MICTMVIVWASWVQSDLTETRAITAYLSSQTLFGDVREKFVRLQQFSTILNLDSVSTILILLNPTHLT